METWPEGETVERDYENQAGSRCVKGESQSSETADGTRSATDRACEAPAGQASPNPHCSLEDAREFFSQALRRRRLRSQHFGDALFGFPTWDIFLSLMFACLEFRGITFEDLVEEGPIDCQRLDIEVGKLLRLGMIEKHALGAKPGRSELCLSRETMRQMMEFYVASRSL